MKYREFAPHVALQPWVKCLWLLEADAQQGPVEPERMVPDGKSELIVHYGDDFERAQPELFQKQERVLLAGQARTYSLLRPTGRVAMIGARFRTVGASDFFRIAMHEVTDHVENVLDGATSRRLEEQVAEATSDETRIAVLQDFLLARRPNAVDPMSRLVERFLSSQGELSGKQLERLSGWSERQTERHFLRAVGLGPRVLARVMRFQRAFSFVQAGGRLGLSAVATACGYFDQPHFIRDFKAFSGLAPTKFFAQTDGSTAWVQAMSDPYNPEK
ncbi:MAG: AraC family transcriptional regulator [Archangium sp.]|nr:AraC family transcriptional regulator [Archangium sp.]